MTIEVSSVRPLLQVFDMPTSVRFYRDVLGFEVAQTSSPGEHFAWALLRLNGAEVMLNTAYDEGERPDTRDAARTAAHGDTILYFGCPDVGAAYEHLRAHGVEVAAPHVTHYGMRQLYVADADGYSLCFQWPA